MTKLSTIIALVSLKSILFLNIKIAAGILSCNNPNSDCQDFAEASGGLGHVLVCCLNPFSLQIGCLFHHGQVQSKQI